MFLRAWWPCVCLCWLFCFCWCVCFVCLTKFNELQQAAQTVKFVSVCCDGFVLELPFDRGATPTAAVGHIHRKNADFVGSVCFVCSVCFHHFVCFSAAGWFCCCCFAHPCRGACPPVFFTLKNPRSCLCWDAPKAQAQGERPEPSHLRRKGHVPNNQCMVVLMNPSRFIMSNT